MTSNLNENTQRAIVLQLLREDHPQDWSRAELQHELSDVEPLVNSALARLKAEGVAVLRGEQVRASRCARHIDFLELIAI